mmetsp:Transcript_21498/g.41907  ORF Transcript_21498/g.41907 Transcript_21498/m.41907 type:complete len:218 (-) Transcript_21498:625-1278(-)
MLPRKASATASVQGRGEKMTTLDCQRSRRLAEKPRHHVLKRCELVIKRIGEIVKESLHEGGRRAAQAGFATARRAPTASISATTDSTTTDATVMTAALLLSLVSEERGEHVLRLNVIWVELQSRAQRVRGVLDAELARRPAANVAPDEKRVRLPREGRAQLRSQLRQRHAVAIVQPRKVSVKAAVARRLLLRRLVSFEDENGLLKRLDGPNRRLLEL